MYLLHEVRRLACAPTWNKGREAESLVRTSPYLSVRCWTAGAVSGASELAGVGPRKCLDTTSLGRAARQLVEISLLVCTCSGKASSESNSKHRPPSTDSTSLPFQPLSSLSSPRSPVRIYAMPKHRPLLRSLWPLSLHHPQVTTPPFWL